MSLRDISKFYPGVVALNKVNISFYEGEIHTLLGENGAGKSTLIKVITGAIQADGGTIVYDGQEFTGLSTSEARAQGIAAVYQDQYYAPDLSVAENLFLGRFPTKNGFIDRKKLKESAQQVLKTLNLDIPVGRLMRDVPFSYRQMIEIAKAASEQTKVLILDESTAALTENEIDQLFAVMRKLAQRGVAIVFISHRIEEVFTISDRITVMRDGEAVSTIDRAHADRKKLLSLMVGRDFSETYPKKENMPGEVVLEARNISGARFRDISFSVRAGEILGVAGLVGAGRTEIMRAIFGADRMKGGEVLLDGMRLEKMTPARAIRRGIGLVPEERKEQGVLSSLNVRQNITFATLRQICRAGFIDRKKERALAEEYISLLRIKTPGQEQMATNLSGGNQQKVVLARWLLAGPKVLILDEPTRGIDVGAKQEIYRIMQDIAKQGMAIIMISSEMLELIGMSDRIMVISEGKLSGILEKSEFSQQKILELASGC